MEMINVTCPNCGCELHIEPNLQPSCNQLATDMISRQAAIDVIRASASKYTGFMEMEMYTDDDAVEAIEGLPSAQPEKQHERIFQEIIVEYPSYSTYPECKGKPYFSIKYAENGQEFIGYGTYKPEVLSEYLKEYFMPSAQAERTCVNCGRTVNNGGWYADGGTRCPIEEHYTLSKDGYCHLWEKRNMTDDDYPEGREE